MLFHQQSMPNIKHTELAHAYTNIPCFFVFSIMSLLAFERQCVPDDFKRYWQFMCGEYSGMVGFPDRNCSLILQPMLRKMLRNWAQLMRFKICSVQRLDLSRYFFLELWQFRQSASAEIQKILIARKAMDCWISFNSWRRETTENVII